MSYQEAKQKYAAIGVDTDAAIARLKTVPISLHCWQGDDVRGFDTDPSKPLTGGIQTTGNYPGRARTPEELMADIDVVLSLCPGTKKINLHASYAIFDEENPWVDRDKLEPKHFRKWVDFCKARGLGADFNPTYFSLLFKKETGMNFLEYLTDVRIREAKRLLSDPRKTIADVAAEVGYNDVKHFSRVFTRSTGIHPSKYRKLYY